MAKRKVVKNLSAHRKNFADLLNKFGSYGYSRWNAFTDFLELSAISIASCDRYGLLTTKETLDERENQYRRIIGKYRQETQPLFGQMLAQIVAELESYCPNHLTDVLGELFHELEFNDRWKGQFFTPQNVCDMIGMMNFGDCDAAIKSKGFVSVNEPCCGGGALLLGAANGMRAAGYNPNTQMLIVAGDIDERCVHMCYVQLSLYGLPAIVQRKNALTQETFGEPWYTPVFLIDGWIWKMRHLVVEKIPLPEETNSTRGQMSLF